MNAGLRGILLMLVAILTFSLLDGIAKYVMQTLPPPGAVFFRYFISCLLSLAIIARAGGLPLFVTRHPWLFWMILIGNLAFGDVPDLWTLIGAAIVITSGLFVFARERTLGKQAEVPAPVD